MDDSILRYYEAEMRYLREAGKEFAEAHPDRARMLNLDRVGDRDPYVERLFEGFAFLTGRLRQKLDDELPELTEGLVSLLWPHYLRMIPSLSILELTPALETLQKTEIVPAGAFRCAPRKVGQSGVQCLYRTTQAGHADADPVHRCGTVGASRWAIRDPAAASKSTARHVAKRSICRASGCISTPICRWPSPCTSR